MRRRMFRRIWQARTWSSWCGLVKNKKKNMILPLYKTEKILNFFLTLHYHKKLRGNNRDWNSQICPNVCFQVTTTGAWMTSIFLWNITNTLLVRGVSLHIKTVRFLIVDSWTSSLKLAVMRGENYTSFVQTSPCFLLILKQFSRNGTHPKIRQEISSDSPYRPSNSL